MWGWQAAAHRPEATNGTYAPIVNRHLTFVIIRAIRGKLRLVMILERLARWLTSPAPSDTLGACGERAAARFLKGKRYRILATNWRCDGGEVDIIARDGQWLVFVEVKTRRAEFVTPEEQVHSFKEGRVRHAADVYLARQRRRGADELLVRFDIVAVVWLEGAKRPTIRHIEHAFE